MNIKPRTALILILAILSVVYMLDFDIFKTLLIWALGGAIVMLINFAVFGNLIQALMKNKDVQDIIQLIKDAKDALLESNKNHRSNPV
jgi:putative exporter of polyketide antibiotics